MALMARILVSTTHNSGLKDPDTGLKDPVPGLKDPAPYLKDLDPGHSHTDLRLGDPTDRPTDGPRDEWKFNLLRAASRHPKRQLWMNIPKVQLVEIFNQSSCGGRRCPTGVPH